MFTIEKGTKLDSNIIIQAIKYNQKIKPLLSMQEKYYIGLHDIFNRKKPQVDKNEKVMTNHARYITDMYVGYMLGYPCEWQVSEGYDIDPILTEFKEQDMSSFDVLMAKKISIFGRAYELEYADEENNVRSSYVDPRNAICIYDDTVQHNKMYAIVYGDNPLTSKKETDVIVYDDIYKYVYTGNKDGFTLVSGEDGKKPHGFKNIPVIHYMNNDEELGDFQPVISLIDAYNILQSDRINDKEQLVEAILVGYGFNLTPEQKKDLKNDRMMFGLNKDDKLEYLIKTFNEGDIDVLRKNIENDIHKISMCPNMSDENFIGNGSGVALSYKLLPFEQNTKNKERYFEKGLKERFQLYNEYLSQLSKIPDIPMTDVDVVFKTSLPQNLLETSQIINNLTNLVDKETLIGLLPFVKDASEVIEKVKQENEDDLLIDQPSYGQDNSEE